MKGQKVKIIKLGTIIRTDRADNKSLPTIMITDAHKDISDSELVINREIVIHCLSILKEKTEGRYNILRSSGIVIQRDRFGGGTYIPEGIADSDPMVGESFSINRDFHTSKLDELIGHNIIITKNSVYLLYNKELERDVKINNLIG
jgi:hypothetical protein